MSPENKANGDPVPGSTKLGPVGLLETVVDRFAIGANVIGTLVVLGLVAIVCADIVARNL